MGRAGEAGFRVEAAAQGRLMRIVPDPVIWTSPANADSVKSTNVAFFQGGAGALRIGAVLL